MIRVGIPTTLFASYHLAYWSNFITLSGMEAVFADESTEKTVHQGSRLIPHEFCVPLKLFMGHVQNLLEKDVQQILIPRMIAQGKMNYFCPKLIALPEIVQSAFGLEKRQFFSPYVVCNGLNIKMIRLPEMNRDIAKQMKMAEVKSNQAWETILSQCRWQQVTLPEVIKGRKEKRSTTANPLRIGLLGYAYNLYDPFISKKVLTKLDNLGVKIVTWEMLEPALIERELTQLKRPLYWNFGKMVLGAGLHFLEASDIDGVIYVTTFGCGPDSIASHILSQEASIKHKPLLHLNLDEHTEIAHINTRLEAFVDLLANLKEEHVV